MESPTFIEVFLKNKNNTFLKHPTLDRQFQTGAFITKTKDLIDYLDYRTPEGLCNPYRCIEDDICYFFKNIKKNNFTLVSKSGMLRHDAAIDTWVEY
jgi:hypothetical protein